MKKAVLILMVAIMIFVITGCTKAENKTYQTDKMLVELELNNVKVKKITYYDGYDIVVDSGNDELVYEEAENYLGITSTKKADMKLQLPENKRYHIKYEDGNLYFDKDGVVYLGSDYAKIEMNGDTLQVVDEDVIVTLFKNGDLIVMSDDDDGIMIRKDGFFTREAGEWSEYSEEEELSGFWGKALAGVIRFAVRAAMDAIGETPEEIVVNVMKEYGWRNSIEAVIDKVEVNAGNISMNKYKETRETSESSEGVETFSVDNFNGSVNIERSEDESIKVTATIFSEKEENLQKVEIKQTGGSNYLVESIALIKNPRCSVKYEIKLPAGIEIRDIKSSNGAIKISDCEGNSELNTSNGNIEVDNHQGNLKLRTSNASIEAIDIEGNVYARSSNGKIRADEVNGKVSAKTSNGKIEITDCAILERAQTSNSKVYVEIFEAMNEVPIVSSNGSIEVVIKTGQGIDIEASTSNGRIDLHNVDLDIGKKSKNRLKAKYQGGGALLDIETSNGDIDIYEKKAR